MLPSQQSWFSSLYPWNEVEDVQISPMVVYRGLVSSRYGAYTHPYYTWWWFESGSVKLETPEEIYEVKAGQWIFIPSGIRRIQTFTNDCHILSMNFFAHWPDGLPLLYLPHPLTGSTKSVPELYSLAVRICNILEKNNKNDNHLVKMKFTVPEVLSIKSALHDFVTNLFGYVASSGGSMTIVPREDPRLAKVLNWIQANQKIGPLPFSEWREQTGLGRSQLENLARKHLKMSLAAYRNRLLTAEACRRLGTPSVLIKQVASSLGFVDSSHFCRWLRQQTGRSPADYRNYHV